MMIWENRNIKINKNRNLYEILYIFIIRSSVSTTEVNFSIRLHFDSGNYFQVFPIKSHTFFRTIKKFTCLFCLRSFSKKLVNTNSPLICFRGSKNSHTEARLDHHGMFTYVGSCEQRIGIILCIYGHMHVCVNKGALYLYPSQYHFGGIFLPDSPLF